MRKSKKIKKIRTIKVNDGRTSINPEFNPADIISDIDNYCYPVKSLPVNNFSRDTVEVGSQTGVYHFGAKILAADLLPSEPKSKLNNAGTKKREYSTKSSRKVISSEISCQRIFRGSKF